MLCENQLTGTRTRRRPSAVGIFKGLQAKLRDTEEGESAEFAAEEGGKRGLDGALSRDRSGWHGRQERCKKSRR